MIWYRYPELLNRKTLREFVNAGLSVREIAHRIGCSKSSVETALQTHGIQRPIISMPEEVRKKLKL